MGKKNYPSDYANLQRTRLEAKSAVEQYNVGCALEVVSNYTLNQEALNVLDQVLEHMGSYTNHKNAHEPTIDLSLPRKEQVSAYWNESLQDDEQGGPFEGSINYKYVEMLLTWYRDSFYRLLGDVYRKIKEFCMFGDGDKLDDLLKENVWIADLLCDRDGQLGISAIENNHCGILEILYTRNTKIKNYSQKFWDVAVKNDTLSCMKVVLQQDKSLLLSLSNELLDSESVLYKSNAAVANRIDLFSECLDKGGYKAMSKFCYGVFWYKSDQHESAIRYFNEVAEDILNTDLAIRTHYYLGLCYKYLQRYILAKASFENVMECKITKLDSDEGKYMVEAKEQIRKICSFEEDRENRIKHKAEYLELLDEISKNEILQKMLSDSSFAESVAEFIEQRYADDVGNGKSKAAASSKTLKQLLAKVKYIKIKEVVSEKVALAAEFQDVKEIYEGFFAQFGDAENESYTSYVGALKIIDHALEFIGRVSYALE